MKGLLERTEIKYHYKGDVHTNEYNLHKYTTQVLYSWKNEDYEQYLKEHGNDYVTYIIGDTSQEVIDKFEKMCSKGE